MVLEASDNCSSTGTSDLTLPAGVSDAALQKVELVVRNLSLESTSNLFHNSDKALKKIVAIDLSENKLSALRSNEFSTMSNVAVLNVSNNQLTTLEEGAFAGLIELTNLILASNHLSKIPYHCFAGLPNLHTLNLNNNMFKILAPYPFANLKTLHIEFNEIQTILSCTVHPEIQELFLRGNQITNIEDLKNFNSSIKLDLSLNPHLSLTNRSFEGWHSLEHLIIDNIHLNGSDLLPEILNNTQTLRELSMSNTGLEVLKIADFPSLPNLISLKINGNRLTTFDYQLLMDKFPQFHEIAIAGNQWNCTFLNEMLDDFKQRHITVLDMPNVNKTSCGEDDNDASEDEVDLLALAWLGLSVMFVFIALALFLI
jgi:Leucine-rich repeat (LRR) protein